MVLIKKKQSDTNVKNKEEQNGINIENKHLKKKKKPSLVQLVVIVGTIPS